MLLANFFANMIGVLFITLFTGRSFFPTPPEIVDLIKQVNMIFSPCTAVFSFILIVLYERPIRQYLNSSGKDGKFSQAILPNARRRLLNEPIFIISLNLFWWIIAAILFSSIFRHLNAGPMIIRMSIVISIQTGLVASVAAFFMLEYILQNKMAPIFFPEGGLFMTPKTIRVKVTTRLAALLFACNILPLISFLNIRSSIFYVNQDSGIMLVHLRAFIFSNSLIFLVTGIFLTFIVSANLKKSLHEIIRILQRVRHGQFDQKIKVSSNDEIGYTGDVINEMTDGLTERDRIRASLLVAMEVQQNFLPGSNPEIEGLDIAGTSIYCDETGGDYYDFLEKDGITLGRVTAVVGDVTGHGIQSALLMASARALIRQRSSLPGNIDQVVTDVNRHLSQDVGVSGRFMTLFYLNIDPQKNQLNWVRAGHDPAILYDPKTDKISELHGTGIALGCDEDFRYESNENTDFTGGKIILMGTDGIWEATNSNGDMFGKEPVYQIIRDKASSSAVQIQEAVIEELNHFTKRDSYEDDVTLVVIKKQIR